MKPSPLTQSLGLILAGFLLGIIVASFNRTPGSFPLTGPGHSGLYTSQEPAYQMVAQTGVWDILMQTSAGGRSVALAQNGLVRVVVHDDKSALHVMTYKEGDAIWQGRLMDVGNDGTVEVADLSYGHCEAFSPPVRSAP